jgi:LmbE family N-acetylglucosaminyl deacetylase
MQDVTRAGSFDRSDRVVVVSPHSDDAAYSLSGLIHLCHNLDKQITVLTVFSCSTYAPRLFFRGRERVTRVRRREDDRFAATVAPGCRMVWLEECDARLRPDYRGTNAHTSRPMTAGDLVLTEKLALTFRQKVDPSSTIYLPLGVGGHVDHVIVREAGLALLAAGCRSMFLYEDLPYAAKFSVAGLEDQVRRMTFAGADRLVPCRVTFPGLLACKQQALACYPSQVTRKVLSAILTHARQVGGPNEAAERVWQVS